MPYYAANLKVAVLPVATFVAGVALALSLTTQAKAPDAKNKDRTSDRATVVTTASSVAKLSPNGAASIRQLARGQQAFIGLLTLNGGGKVPKHADATEEFIYVIDGGGTLHIDGKKHRIGPGTMVYMPAGATVSYANGPTPLVALQVFAGPSPADKYGIWKPAR